MQDPQPTKLLEPCPVTNSHCNQWIPLGFLTLWLVLRKPQCSEQHHSCFMLFLTPPAHIKDVLTLPVTSTAHKWQEQAGDGQCMCATEWQTNENKLNSSKAPGIINLYSNSHLYLCIYTSMCGFIHINTNLSTACVWFALIVTPIYITIYITYF